jgi:hypothetical protein
LIRLGGGEFYNFSAVNPADFWREKMANPKRKKEIMKLFLMIFEFDEYLQLAIHIFDLLLDVFRKIGGRWRQTCLS